jgi:hypothetical protein
MANGNGFSEGQDRRIRYRELADDWPPANRVHPAWLAFVHFCQELRRGETERLKIQDGLPVLAEVTTKKVKFT